MITRNPVFPGERYEWNLITISYAKSGCRLNKEHERTRTNKLALVNVYDAANTKFKFTLTNTFNLFLLCQKKNAGYARL